MKLDFLQLCRRIGIDLGTGFSLICAGVGLSWLFAFGGPLDFAGRHENIVWILIVVAIGIARAYVENLWRISGLLWSRIAWWICIVTVVHVMMCWIDTLVVSEDTFINVFAFGLMIFFLPSLVVSTGAYAIAISCFKGRRAVT
jgi:hypothetical protein